MEKINLAGVVIGGGREAHSPPASGSQIEMRDMRPSEGRTNGVFQTAAGQTPRRDSPKSRQT